MKKKNKKRPISHIESSKTVKLPAFAWTVDIIFSEDIHATSKRLNYSELGEAVDAAHLWRDDARKSWLLFHYGCPPGHIAHEAWHCVRRLLLDSGAELENEVVAYHLGYLVDEIHSFHESIEAEVL